VALADASDFIDETGVVFAAQSARRESRIRSRRGVTPSRLLLAGQCQARFMIGRRSWVASPTPNPTWPPTRTREVVTATLLQIWGLRWLVHSSVWSQLC